MEKVYGKCAANDVSVLEGEKKAMQNHQIVRYYNTHSTYTHIYIIRWKSLRSQRKKK